MINPSKVPSKHCRDCSQRLPLNNFWKRSASPDGYALYCKKCFAVRNDASRRAKVAYLGKKVKPRSLKPAVVAFGHRWCPGCESAQPLIDFVRSKSRPDGYGSYCRPCQNAKVRESRQRVHGGSRHYHLTRRYGIGAAEVASMVKAQSHVCPVCLRTLDGKAHVDHDHATGKVRAVLCFNCNGGLGQFRDRPEVLRRAAAYVEGNVWTPIPVAAGVFRLPS